MTEAEIVAPLREVLALAKRGWPVFPCSPNDKRPLTENGFQDASTDPDRIEAWSRKWPNAMWAVPTGSPIGAFVVDLDPKDGATAEQLIETLRIKCGGRLPPRPMVRTPRGGLHLYFALPAGVEIGNRAGFLAMCDIRGTGGYVIVPPSIRRGPKAVKDRCDGIGYAWEEDAGLDDFDPSEPPAALVLMAVSKDRGETEDKPGREDRSVRPAPANEAGTRERRYALAAFDDEIRAVQNAGKGMRNSALNTAALKLGSLVAAGALSESMVQAALEDAASLSGLVKDDGWRSVRATIASGFKAGLAKPRDLSTVNQASSRSDQDRDPAPRKEFTNQTHRPNAGSDRGDPPSVIPPEDEDTRRVIRIKAGRLPEAVAEAEAALIKAGPGPIYQRSGELVHIARRPVRRSDGSEETQEAVVNVEQAAMLEELAYIARFERLDVRNKGWTTIDPPAKIAEAYFGRRVWKLPNLHHLIATPTLRPDGSILAAQGYDADTGLYLTWELKGLKVPEHPSQDDAEIALATLTEIFRGFPYADRTDEQRAGLGLSVILAGLIGAILRPTLPAAPLIGVTAPKAGTGKSYLVDLISMIATGRRATCLVSGVKLEEFEKSLGAILLASMPLLSLDNMVQPLTGQLICMALSQERIDMRVLGLSKTANLPTTTALFATGNNLKLQGDLTRRSLLCRLDARMERPEERTFDTDLLAEVRNRRAELVSAVLTIARWGFVRRQRRSDWSLDDPEAGLPFAGFETWCRRVRDPLIALGCRDPVMALDDVRATDAAGENLRILVATWDAEVADKSLICKEAIHKAQIGPGPLLSAMEAVAADHSGDISPRKLGNFLSAHEGSVVNLTAEDDEPRALAFYRDGKHQNAVRWQLRSVEVS